MQAEYDSLIENETWKLTAIPENRQVISGRWCFKLKKDRDGQILKYKARRIAVKVDHLLLVDLLRKKGGCSAWVER